MVRPVRRSAVEDDLEDLDDLDDDRERWQRRRSKGRGAARSAPGPVTPWEEPFEDEEELELPPEPKRRRWKIPVFWRARDSLYFEPLVALAVIVVLLVSLFAYTSNWPPVYAVESNSMQHGSGDRLGELNAGDVVLAQKLPQSQITPYAVGLSSGESTYGAAGDVILYYPNGDPSVTPVVHRAIVFLVWNPGNSSYDAPELAGLPCGASPDRVYNTSGTSGNCGTAGLRGALTLYHVGGRSNPVSIDLMSTALGGHSGFLTLGDNATSNPNFDQYGTGLPAISTLVKPSWVIGVARGMIPWFGAVKLLFEGNAGLVPGASWELMGLTIAGLFLLALGIHLALRSKGIESPLRRREEEEARDAFDDEEPTLGRRFARAIRPWSADETDDDEVERRPAAVRSWTPQHEERRRKHFISHRGRPHPRVQRGRGKGSRDRDDL